VPFNYPDIEFENDATLLVRGLPYRAYSSGADIIANAITDIDDTDSLASDFTLSPGDDISLFVEVLESEYNGYFGFLDAAIDTDFASETLDVIINSAETGDLIEERIQSSDSGIWTEWVPFSDVGTFPEIIEFEITNPSSASGDVTVGANATSLGLYSPEHAHEPDPGITEFAGDTPTSVDVIIEGNTVATDIGSGTFETEVDISGEMTAGQWNDIELSSSSLGHIQATVSIDGYKQIGKR